MNLTLLSLPYIIILVFMALLLVCAGILHLIRSRRTEASESSRAEDLPEIASARFLLDYVHSPLTENTDLTAVILSEDEQAEMDLIEGSKLTPIQYDKPFFDDSYAPTRPNPRLRQDKTA
ncbi:MAG: hypothetical protein AAFN11_02145 [Chloroflexota bacterium]